MTTARMLTAAAAAAALLTGTAFAQTMPMPAQGTAPMPAQSTMPMPAQSTMPMPAQGMAPGMMADATPPPCIPAVGSVEAGGMSGTAPGMAPPTITASANGLMMCTSGTGTIVVSNAPIPDSPQTRARTGGPDSAAGRRTAPRPGVTRR